MSFVIAIISVFFIGLLLTFILYILDKNDPRNFLNIEKDTIAQKQNYNQIKDFVIYTTNNGSKFVAHKCRFDIGDKVNKDLSQIDIKEYEYVSLS